MSCDIGEATGSLENEQSFTYVTVHSPTLPSLHLRHSSFSNPSVPSPTSQLILEPFFRFSYVTCSSPGEPPMTFSLWYENEILDLLFHHEPWASCMQFVVVTVWIDSEQIAHRCKLVIFVPTSLISVAISFPLTCNSVKSSQALVEYVGDDWNNLGHKEHHSRHYPLHEGRARCCQLRGYHHNHGTRGFYILNLCPIFCFPFSHTGKKSMELK